VGSDWAPLTADPKLKCSLRRGGLEVTQAAFPIQIAARELTDIGLDSRLRIRGLLIRVCGHWNSVIQAIGL
jgi:hypothetical protein